MLKSAWSRGPTLPAFPSPRMPAPPYRLPARPLGAAGNLSSDAHLAAIAIEHGAEVNSCDTNFARFPGLRWKDPLA